MKHIHTFESFINEANQYGSRALDDEFISESVTEGEIIAAIKLMEPAAEAAGFQLHGKINTKPGKRFIGHAVWTVAGEQHIERHPQSRYVALVWSKSTGLYVQARATSQDKPSIGTPQEWSDKLRWERAFE
jgi:hypothetical protein